MKKHLTIRNLIVGVGLAFLSFTGPAHPDSLNCFPKEFPVTSLILPQSMLQPPAKVWKSNLVNRHRFSWGISGDLILIGCAVTALSFARGYRRVLLARQTPKTSR